MKKTFKTITAVGLALVMLSISPLTDLSQGATDASAATAEVGEVKGPVQVYISDVKIGNAYVDGDDGPSLKETVKQLRDEGYTVLKDGNDYADLNAGNKPPNIKSGPTEKIIVLGYKTTMNPEEAITDLAVMNMNGGYDVLAYDKLVKTQMESQIKPFMNNFVSALEEYRENLKKPVDSKNYIRADFMRKLLNKITDDDTGGRPLGDLLVNKTKYEMGDAAYNSLSNEEKKDHADILTIMMQGNQPIVMEVENIIARATDTSDSTWIERLQQISLSDLRDEVLAEKPNLTKKDVNDELDKRYQDDAKRILKKWPELATALRDVDSAQEKIDDYDGKSLDKAMVAMETLDEDAAPEEILDAFGEMLEQQSDTVETANAGTTVAVSEFLEETDYDFKVGGESGSTLLGFFSQDASLFTGNKIRELYPVVASLTPGQLAGLDLINARDLVVIGMNETDGFQDTSLSEMDTVSVYDGIDREIYKTGGVGLTSDELRKNAESAQEIIEPSFGNWATIVFTVLSALTIASVFVVRKLMTNATVLKTVTFEQVISTHYLGPHAAPDKIQKELITKTDDVERFSEASINTVTVILSVVALGLLVASIVTSVLDYQSQFDVEFKSIPNYMVDEADITAYNERGEKILLQNQTAFYKPATCTRVEGTSTTEKNNYKKLLDRADLNGDIGQQWLALYYLKNYNAAPILADSFVYQQGGGDVPDGYSTGIHEFGGTAATDLNKRAYLFTEDAPMIRVYYKKAEIVAGTSVEQNGNASSDDSTGQGGTTSDTAGSIIAEDSGDGSASGITAGGLALGGGIGIILGALLMALIMYFARRKRRYSP